MSKSKFSKVLAVGAIVAMTLTAAAPAHAGAVRVSSNGVDSGTCGIGSESPCATIAQAVTNSFDGDTISVGPGSYAGATVNKSVALASSAGTGGAIITSGMVLAANGIEFGKRGRGFSLTGLGTLVEIAADEVSVIGNVVSDCTTGVQVSSGAEAVVRDNSFDGCGMGVSVLAATAAEVRGNRFGYSQITAIFLGAASSSAVVRENRTFGPSGSGVSISGSDHLLWRNLVHGTPSGGFVATNVDPPTNVELRENLVVSTGSPGYFLQDGSGWALNKNAALNINAPGFYILTTTPVSLAGNIAIGCSSQGIFISGGSDHVLTGNSALQNTDVGMVLTSIGTGVTVSGGNLYGNGGGNCGLANVSGSAMTTSDVYWGDPAGPGADPADAVCGNIPLVTVESSASSPAKMKMPGIK
ncbi:MAG: NosD domain-containing protein [Candidatus Binatia bacterium]